MGGMGLRSALQHDSTLNSIGILQAHGVQHILTEVTAAIVDIAISQRVRGEIASVNGSNLC